MKISARNQFKGKVVAIEEGAVNCLVSVKLAPKIIVTSAVTKQAIQELGIAKGKDAYVIVKASSVLLGTE